MLHLKFYVGNISVGAGTASRYGTGILFTSDQIGRYLTSTFFRLIFKVVLVSILTYS
jgi:hypothetical protein